MALIYGQMNEPPGARMRVGLSALTITEYFREELQQDVLLFIDISIPDYLWFITAYLRLATNLYHHVVYLDPASTDTLCLTLLRLTRLELCSPRDRYVYPSGSWCKDSSMVSSRSLTLTRSCLCTSKDVSSNCHSSSRLLPVLPAQMV